MNHIIHTWSLLDKCYYHCSRLQCVNQEEQNVFRVRLLTYRGQNLSLSDGTIIQSQDLLLKIHLHNCMLIKEMQGMDHDVKRALYVHNRVERSLPGLAQFVLNHPERDRIKGILGITLLSRGVKRLGFDSLDIPNPIYKRIKALYLIPMFCVCHHNLKLNSFKKENLTPKYLAMSKEILLDRFL